MAAEISTNVKHSVAGVRRRRGWVAAGIAAAVLIGGAAVFAGGSLYAKYQHDQAVSSAIDVQTFYPGIVVNGVSLGGKTMEQAQAAVKATENSLRGNYSVKVSSGGKSWDLTQDSLVFSYNTDQVLREAYAYARSGDREARYRQVEALKSSPKKYSITKSIDDKSLKSSLQKIADSIDRDPVNPTVTSFDAASKTFHYKDGVNGVKTDLDKLYSEVVGVLNDSGTGSVTVPTSSTPFTVPLSEVKGRMKKLGSYSTVSKNSAAGTHNMALALSTVNGTKVSPGGTFSFLGVVGPGSSAQGYQKAGAILNGKLIQEDGGGICQASTTIYGAALRSNMKITERSNHSIPSSYCPIGQDATVSYPSLDFKFQNPTDYPIFIVTSTAGKVMTVTLYGYQPPDYDNIEVSSKVTATYPVSTEKKYTQDNTLAKGAVKLVSKARGGYRATAVRTFYQNGKVVKTENLPSSYYKPQPAFYAYGSGANISSSKQSASSHAASSKPSSSSQKPASSSSGASAAADDDVTAAGSPAA